MTAGLAIRCLLLGILLGLFTGTLSRILGA